MQITKFDEQSRHQHDKLMKQAAEQEAQRKAKEERRKAEEEAKRAAEEEARKLAKEKAKVKVATEAMRAQIVQKAGQGEKPKPKVCGMELFSSYFFY